MQRDPESMDGRALLQDVLRVRRGLRRRVLLGRFRGLDGDQDRVSWSTLQHPGIHVDGVLLLSGIVLVVVRVVFVLVAASSA